MRNVFSDTLVALAQADPRVLLLTGDHGYALFDTFRERCEGQYLNAGIAEQNMVGMAAGLARSGFHPFVYGLAAFVPIRVLEQIKLDVAHDQLPVVLIGDGAGLVYSHLGTSHQSTEDIAAVRALPDIEVLSPADRFEMVAAMEHAYSATGPVYLRMGKSDRGDVHSSDSPPSSVRMTRLAVGGPSDPVFLATGSMVVTALHVAPAFGAEVWTVPRIKPLEPAELVSAVGGRTVIVMEEHSVIGGLGSAVTEILSEYQPTPVLRVGVNDRFSALCGTHEYLLREHRLDAMSVTEKISAFLVGT